MSQSRVRVLALALMAVGPTVPLALSAPYPNPSPLPTQSGQIPPGQAIPYPSALYPTPQQPPQILSNPAINPMLVPSVSLTSGLGASATEVPVEALSPEALAQIGLSAAQTQILTNQNATILAVQLAQATPPGDLQRQMDEYFSNGAQATGVPTTGPGAAYFNNAASLLTVPTSVVPAFPPPESTVAPAAPPPAVIMPPPQPPTVYVFVQPTPAPTTTEMVPVPSPTESASTAPPAETGSATTAPPAETAPSTPLSPSETTTAPLPPPAAPANEAPPTAQGTITPGIVVALMLGGAGVGAMLVLIGARVRRHA